jgi:hypothetical protein
MVIVRYAPGTVAPVSGWFKPCGHYGEEISSPPVWRAKGETLPLIEADEEFAPFWFVEQFDEKTAAQVA